jgi:LacI family transcriptional regulator
MSRTISQESIAQAVGVSKNAVSLALAGKPGVSEKTRQRVVQVAEQLGYSKPEIAPRRKARRAQAQTIGIVVRETFLQETLFFGPLLAFIQHQVAALGMNTLVHALSPEEEEAVQMPDWLDSQNLSGLLTISKISTKFLDALSRHLPMVLVDHYDPLVACDAVLTANMVGGFVATHHLITLNHDHIGFMGLITSDGAPSNYERAAGYQMALTTNPRCTGPEMCLLASETDSVTLSKQLDDLSTMPTAWFCANDVVAFHLVRCLRDRGVDVPNDVSVVGFDDLQLATVSEPPLTTLRVDPNLFARRAVDRLVWRMNHPDVAVEHLSIRPTFISRASTRARQPS